MEKQRRRDARGIVGKIAAVVFAAGFVLSIVPAIRALAEGTIFKIQSAEITEISTGATGSINTYDEQTIVSNVTFHKINDSISYKIVLQNSDSKDHIIESITDDNASESINYIYDTHAGETVAAGADLDFLLTAKYANGVTDTSKRAEVSNAKFFIKFTDVEEPEEIDIVVPDTNEEETPEAPENPETPEVPVEPNTDEDIPAVPDTGKNTAESNGASINLATMIISVIGLTILAIIAVKKHKKYAKIIGVAVVAVSAFGLATTAKAANIETNSFTLTTNYGLYDKLVIKNGDDNVIINYGDKLEDAGEITNPTKPGYIFSGWQDEDGDDIDLTNPIYEDLTIKPKFTAISYKVRFNANGGAGEMADQTFTYNEAANLAANTFTYAGRAYAGWDTEANGSGVHYDDAQSVKNLTTVDNGVVNLYAQWSINPYYINYNANGGEGEMATTNCEYDEDCQLRANAFTKYGYDFAGWKYGDQTFTDGQIVHNLIEQGTITLEAQWTPTEYEIHYDGITDEERFALNNPTTYTIETPAFQLHNPADRKDNDGDTVQVFVGWQETTTYPIIVLPNTNNLGTKTYKAIWGSYPLPRYAITYNLDGGAATNPTTHNKAESFTLNNPTKTGYTFTGWTGTTIEGDTPVMNYTLPAPHVRNNIEFTAHYRKNTYTIVFAKGADDATGVTASIAAEYDTEYDLPASGFARTGYTQAGWKNGEETIAADAKVKNLTAEDGATVTLAANWIPNTFTVIYHANNDAVSNPTAMNNQVVTYDETTTLTPNAYEYEHYKFMGWATSENGAKVYDDGADIMNAVSEDNGILNLYAVWLERTAMFTIGATVNNALKELNSNASTFTHYTAGIPDFVIIDGERDIATSTSNFPIWVWTDGGTIYWWSEAEKPSLNPDSLQMFYANNYVTISLADINTSTATNLTNFMSSNKNLRNIDLGDGDFTNVTTMSSAFSAIGNNYTTEKLTIDLSSIKTSNKLTDTSRLFAESYYIGKIIFSDEFETSGVTNFAEMFRGCGSLSEIVGVEDFDTTSAIYLNGMFWNNKITSLDLTGWNTSNVTTIQQIFRGCSALATLNVSNWDVRKVTKMQDAFPLPQVTTLDLSQWQNSVVTNMDTMFAGASKLTEIDLSGIDTSHIASWGTSNSNIFNSTSKLETIYVSDKFIVNSDAYGWFFNDDKLEGGAGTKNNISNDGWYGTFARIDEPCDGKPGYFTWKDHRYVCYYANYDNANQTTAGQYITTTASDHLATKPITRQGYTLLGWSTTPDGEIVYADGAEIETEFSKDPIKLYAHWEPMDVTITFHSNFDGVNDTMAQQTITVGEQNNLDANQYSVDHYRFLGWTTEPQGRVMGNESTAIDYADQASTAGFVGDTNLYAKWLYRCRTFATDSWNTIVTNLESDSTYYDATDVCEKEIKMDLNNDEVNETYGLRLINTSTPEECSTPGFSQTACGTVIEFTNYVGIWQWNSVNSTNGGWANATLATRLNGEDLYGKMPEELRSVIIPTYPIVSGANQNGVSPDITASDTNKNKIYLHTGKELGVPNSAFDDKEDLTRTYDFYGVSEHKPYLNRAGGGGWPNDWWLRSALLSRDNIPLGIKSDVRSMISATPGANNIVATYPAFRIGRKLTVSFNAGEGAASETAREYAVSAMNYSTLPTVTTAPEGKIFAGWYTAAEGGDRVNDNDTFVSSNAHTLYAHWITPTFYNITEMQQMTADICATATTPNTNASQFDTTGENVGNKSYIPRRELIDNRDGKSYQVTKLADGKCWMTENLALGDPDSTMTLTSADSDVTSNLTLPQSNIAAFTGSVDVDAVYVDDTFGGYYSSRVARANYTNEGNSSICPKGWRLPNPTMSTPRDWEILKSTYNISSVNALYGEPFNFTRSFYVGNGAIKRNNGWIDTYYVGPGITSNSYNNFGVYIPDNWTGTSGITGAEGGSVRCVAR